MRKAFGAHLFVSGLLIFAETVSGPMKNEPRWYSQSNHRRVAAPKTSSGCWHASGMCSLLRGGSAMEADDDKIIYPSTFSMERFSSTDDEPAEETARLEALLVEREARRPRGPLPPAWPGPYIANWGQHDPSAPNLYGGEAEARGLALCIAAQAGNGTVCQQLVSEGVDVNFRDPTENDISALHNAAFEGHLEVVQILLQAGASASTEDQDGATPMFYAVPNKDFDIIQLLIDYGASVNHRNHLGNTVLHKAAAFDHFRLVKKLIAMGAHVHAQNVEKDTALHHAAMAGSYLSARALVNAGADVNLRNNEGSSAVREAKMNGHGLVMEYLSKKTNDTSWNNPFPGETYARWADFFLNATARYEREDHMRLNCPASDDFWIAFFDKMAQKPAAHPPGSLRRKPHEIQEGDSSSEWHPNLIHDENRSDSGEPEARAGRPGLNLKTVGGLRSEDLGLQDEGEALQVLQGIEQLMPAWDASK